MLTEEALHLIQSTAVRAAGVHSLVHADRPTVILPDGVKLESIEHLMKARYRFRGQYATQSVAEFNAYVTKRGNAPEPRAADEIPQVFVQAEAGHATAFFNLGTVDHPGHGDDTAMLTLKKTPAYQALCAINGKSNNQRALAEWLEDWGQSVVVPIVSNAESNRMTLAAAVAAIRAIKITNRQESTSRVADTSAHRTEMEEMNAQAHGELALPAGFSFHASPYEGFDARTWAMRMTVGQGQNNTPILTLRIIGEDAVTEAIAQEFEARVRAGAIGAQVYRGSFKVA